MANKRIINFAPTDMAGLPTVKVNAKTVVVGGNPKLEKVEETKPLPGQLERSDLVKSLLATLKDQADGDIDAPDIKAFTADPTKATNTVGVFRIKTRLLPDDVLKRVAVQDDLIGAIVANRANHCSSFGRRQPNRESTGFRIVPDPDIIDQLAPKDKENLLDRIKKAEKLLSTCGAKGGDTHDEKFYTFSQYLAVSTRNIMVLGRLATEAIFDKMGNFHSFRPVDAGTMYRAVPMEKLQEDQIRKEAKSLLERMKGRNKQKNNAQDAEELPDSYQWVQVIEGHAVQAFSDDEMLIHNFFPTTDIEFGGYPLTPIDTCIAQITTHINITTHNKSYFQSGRATRGMLLIKSDDITPQQVKMMRSQLQASVNGVQNAWRVPVFAVPTTGELTWTPMDSGQGASAEFQYLCDQTSRAILSAFQISPEELSGYAYLSKGTNSQSLSESDNEYKIEAARDVGLRPILSQLEDFLNARILPLIDPTLAEHCQIQLLGLDAETAEKEAQRLSETSQIYGTYDDILGQVEKDPVGLQSGGQYPLNPQMQQIIEKFLTVAEIKHRFFGAPASALQDPELQYRPADQTSCQLFMAKIQAQMQPQQPAQPPGGGQEGPGGGGGEAQEGAEAQEQQDQGQAQEAPPKPGEELQQPSDQDLAGGIDQAISGLGKSEAQLPPHHRKLYRTQEKVIASVMDQWEKDAREAKAEVAKLVSKLLPKE